MAGEKLSNDDTHLMRFFLIEVIANKNAKTRDWKAELQYEEVAKLLNCSAGQVANLFLQTEKKRPLTNKTFYKICNLFLGCTNIDESIKTQFDRWKERVELEFKKSREIEENKKIGTLSLITGKNNTELLDETLFSEMLTRIDRFYDAGGYILEDEKGVYDTWKQRLNKREQNAFDKEDKVIEEQLLAIKKFYLESYWQIIENEDKVVTRKIHFLFSKNVNGKTNVKISNGVLTIMTRFGDGENEKLKLCQWDYNLKQKCIYILTVDLSPENKPELILFSFGIDSSSIFSDLLTGYKCKMSDGKLDVRFTPVIFRRLSSSDDPKSLPSYTELYMHELPDALAAMLEKKRIDLDKFSSRKKAFSFISDL